MKTLILIGVALALVSCAEDASPFPTQQSIQQKEPDDSAECVFISEPMPEFPGGVTAMMTFVKENLVYPRWCVEGRVYVGFVVETNGTLSKISVVKGICEECDRNAIEVIRKMPRWKPGRNYQNKLTRTRMILPIKF